MSALKCSNIVNETEMNNICIVPTRRLLSAAKRELHVGGGGAAAHPQTPPAQSLARVCFQHQGIELLPINGVEPASNCVMLKPSFFFSPLAPRNV